MPLLDAAHTTTHQIEKHTNYWKKKDKTDILKTVTHNKLFFLNDNFT
jgi:hypothetical protein